MKRTLTGIAAAALVLGTMAPAAFASTSSTLTSGGGKSISLDGTTLYKGVQVGTGVDAGTPTTYFPIWYLEQALTKAGYTNNYDASTNTWNLQMPGVDASKVAVNGGVGTGNAAIAINGIVVKRVNATWHQDFAGGPNADVTTYFPLVYLQYTLQAAGFTNAWDGSNFGFTSNYGAAAALQVSAASSTLVANNTTTDTVTVTAVDANGHVVRNYSGTALIDITGANNAYQLAATQPSDVTGGNTLNFTNGVATFTLQAKTVTGLTGSVKVTSNGASVINDQFGSAVSASVSVSSVAQVATAVSVKPEQAQVAVNSSGTVKYDVNVLDQAGVAMAGGTYALTGALTHGTFTDGATSGEPIVVTGGVMTPVTVNVPTGVTGSYTLTVTGSGLTTGSGTINAAVAQAASKLTATVDSASTNAITESATGGNVQVDVATADANAFPTGAPVYATHTTLAAVITNSQGTAFANATVKAFDSTNAALNSGNPLTYDTTNNYYALPANTAYVQISDNSGKADAGTYSVTVKDVTASITDYTASAPITYTVSPQTTVGKLGVTAGTNVLTGSSSTSSTTITVQLEDASGNPIAGNSDALALTAAPVSSNQGTATFNGSTTSPYQVKVDGTGKAVVTFAAQNYSGDKWNITVADGAINTTASPTEVDVVSHPAASYSFKIKDTGTTSLAYATAGDTLALADSNGVAQSLDAAGLDANSNKVLAANTDKDNVSVTITHASGINGIATASTTFGTTGALTYTASSDTAVLTGTMTDVSTEINTLLTQKAGKAGTLTINLSDKSTGATGSASINVAAGTAISAVAVPALNGVTTLAKSSLAPVTIQLVDAGGNPVVASTQQTITLGGTLSGVTFQDANHVAQSTITIAAGQSSVSGYLSMPATGSGTITFSDGTYTAYATGTVTVQ